MDSKKPTNAQKNGDQQQSPKTIEFDKVSDYFFNQLRNLFLNRRFFHREQQHWIHQTLDWYWNHQDEIESRKKIGWTTDIEISLLQKYVSQLEAMKKYLKTKKRKMAHRITKD